MKETSSLSRASAEQQRHLLKAAVEEGESSKCGMMEDNPVGTRTRTQISTHAETVDGDVAALEVIHEPGVSD